MVMPIVFGALGTIPQSISKGTGKHVNKMTSTYYYSQNTAKNPEYLTSFAVSQTPLANAAVKNFQRVNNKNNNNNKIIIIIIIIRRRRRRQKR